mgnify:CR=1 FL=1
MSNLVEETRNIMKKYGIRANKDLGQNFLINNEVVEKGMVRCPICGSDKFTTMDKELILKEADDYIRRNGKLVEEKKEK